MFGRVYQQFQKATFFEKLLLFMGFAIGIIGFWLINRMYSTEPLLTWALIQSMFLWFLLIFIIILTDSNESIKEELSIVIKEGNEETKLLRQEVSLLNKIILDQIQEIKLIKGKKKR